ncbi:site-2 protease family protein [Paraburkholderia sp. BR10872]|uniref:site-2 protease family protein n=1 Tax=Paraburkholderia sp. BR10872 TaxID=3236989 RepID=UPI0034D33DBC
MADAIERACRLTGAAQREKQNKRRQVSVTPTDAMLVITTFARMPVIMMGSVSDGRAVAAFLVLPIPTVVANLIAHELGHGFFAILARVQIKGFRIGGGTPIAQWCWRNVHFKLCWALWKGAHIDLGELPNSRWKQLMVYAGGVLGNLAFSIAVWLALPRSAWLECLVVTAVSVACALQNLIPGAPDGNAIWRLVWRGVASSKGIEQ